MLYLGHEDESQPRKLNIIVEIHWLRSPYIINKNKNMRCKAKQLKMFLKVWFILFPIKK